MLIPLHVRSDRSPGLGASPIATLVLRAAVLGLPALALTDVETLSGAVEHHARSREAGVRPITGVELRRGWTGRRAGELEGRVVLLARDRTGHETLCRIVSRRRAGRPGPFEPATEGEPPLRSLEACGAEGLWVLTDDAALLASLLAPRGPVACEQAGLLLALPGPPAREEELRRAAREHGVLLVADADVSLADEAEREVGRLLAAIGDPLRGAQGSSLQGGSERCRAAAPSIHARVPLEVAHDRLARGEGSEEAPGRPGERGHERMDGPVPGEPPIDPSAREVMGGDERLARTDRPLDRWRALSAAPEAFAGAPDAVEAAARIAASCELDLLGSARAPRDAEDPAADALTARCSDALSAHRSGGRLLGSAYDVRLASELATIRALGLAGYLVIVGEILEGARALAIAVEGRGSAVSSLVCHLLGLGSVDPVALSLGVERFLHPLRADLPDVDIDVDSRRREELIAWVSRRFGHERVAGVSTLQTFGLRAAWREGLVACGLPRGEVERFCERLPPDELQGSPAAPPLPLELLPRSLSTWIPAIASLVGRARHTGTHPGGLVISDVGPLDRRLPLERAPGGLVVTQYDLRGVAALGLAKVDLLGSRHLAQLERARELLAARARDPDLEPDLDALVLRGAAAIPQDDERVLARLRAAGTVGCFQVETPAMRSVLRRLPVRDLQDLVAALAIVRPGPASGRAKEAFIRRARGEEPVLALHPELTARLSPTRGLLLYEEDVTAALSVAAGLSLAQADRLRAQVAASHEDPLTLRPIEAGFLEAAARAGKDLDAARRVWAEAARFAAYAFNKAHATSQAALAYRATWLATRAPLELGCALLDGYGGAYPLRTIGAELVRRGIRLLAPSVDRSLEACAPERTGRDERALRIGLGRVKHLRRATIARLVLEARARPFRDLRDLRRRVALDPRELAALVRVGACDHLAPLSADEYPFAHERLLSGEPPPPPPVPRLRERYQALARVKSELELLSLHPSAHPVALLRDEARRAGAVTTLEAIATPDRDLDVVALISASRRVPLADGRVLRFLTLEDEAGLLEAILPPGSDRARELTTPGPYVASGRVAIRQDDPHLVVRGLTPLHERDAPWT